MACACKPTMPRMPKENTRIPISASSRYAPDWHLRRCLLVFISPSGGRRSGRRAMARIVGGDAGVGVAQLDSRRRRGVDDHTQNARRRDVGIGHLDPLDTRARIRIVDQPTEPVERYLGRGGRACSHRRSRGAVGPFVGLYVVEGAGFVVETLDVPSVTCR